MQTRLSLPRSQAWRPALFLVLALLSAFLGVAISFWSPMSSLPATVPLLATVAIVVIGFTRPLGLLAILLAIWAPTLFLIKDVPVADLGNNEVTLSQGFGLLVLLVFAGRSTVEQFRSVGHSPLPRPMLYFAIFTCLMAMGLVLANDFRPAVADFLRFLAGAAVVFAVLRLPMSPTQFQRLYLGAIAGITAAALVTILMPPGGADGGSWTTFGVERVGGTLAGPGVTSSLMVTGIAFLLPLVLLGRRTIKLLAVLASGLALVAIFVTVTRSAIVAVPLLFLALTSISPEIGISRLKVILGCLAVGVVYTLTILTVDNSIVASRLHDIPLIGDSSLGDDETGTGRMGLYRAQVNAFLDAPVLVKIVGHGLHSSFQISSDALGFHLPRGFVVQGPHNSYLWLLSELGLIGLGTYGAFLVGIYNFLQRQLRGVTARTRLGATGVVFCTCFLAYFVTYHLTAEMFGWNIPTFAGRVYFLVFLAMALRCATEPQLLEGLESVMPGSRSTSRSASGSEQATLLSGLTDPAQTP